MEQTNLINSSYRKNVEDVQTTVSTELQTENNIAKMICTQATAVIDNYESINGEIKFNGTVCFSATYVDEMGELFNLTNSQGFTAKLENELINTSTIPMFNSCVIELKTNTDSNEIHLVATVETSVSLILTDTVNFYVSNNEEIITNSNFVSYHSIASNGKTNFNFEESFETKDIVSKLLNITAHSKITEYSLGTDYFTVEGLLYVNTNYETIKDDLRELKQYTKCYKFKEELEIEGITKEGYLLLNSAVKNCEIATKTETKDEITTVTFTIPITVNYAYFKSNNSEVVVDAYSLTNKLNLNIESFKVDGYHFYKCFEEKIDGQMVIDDSAPRIVKFVSYCGENISVTNSFKEKDNLIVEGVASINIVYLEEDEEEKLNSVIVEIPFSVENKCDEIKESDELMVCGFIKDVDVKCKKGKEINLDLDLDFIVNGFNTTEEMSLTNIEVGEALTAKEACLQIYFARKGNTLWDISKGLLVKPEQILDQNPNINLPLEQDEKIVLFKSTDNK